MTNPNIGLSIPQTLDQIQWRLALIAKFNLANIDELTRLLQASDSQNKNTTELRKKFLELALSDKIIIDDFDVSVLVAIDELRKPEELNAKRIMQLSNGLRNMRKFIDPSISDDEFFKKNIYHFDFEKKMLTQFKNRLKDQFLHKIRARIALQELVALFAPAEMLPFLMSFSISYISDQHVYEWIENLRWNRLHGTLSVKKNSEVILKRISKILLGDGNKKRSTQDDWHVSIMYNEIHAEALYYIESHKKKTFNQSEFENFCIRRQIPDSYKLLLFNTKSLKSLILEILAEHNYIQSPKSFDKIHIQLLKVQNKHFGVDLSGIEREYLDYLIYFLDLPAKNPWLLSSSLLKRVFQDIEIT
ncbi:MAG: hypothetical protein H7328_07545 [Bdellovibrio sp.]|nr:hypothetical protein [Bdellovibrio sp.]